MHKLTLGIEHLFTGIQLMEQNPQRPPNSPYHNQAVFTFQQESPTMVRVLCEEPFQTYWPHAQIFLYSTPCSLDEITEYEGSKHQYSQGEAEWWAQKAAQDLRTAYEFCNLERTHKFNGRGVTLDRSPGVILPDVVLKALRRKYGADADAIGRLLQWDGIMKCWTYTHNGIFYGVEEDGYIHS